MAAQPANPMEEGAKQQIAEEEVLDASQPTNHRKGAGATPG